MKSMLVSMAVVLIFYAAPAAVLNVIRDAIRCVTGT
jgi:hypothetical protein